MHLSLYFISIIKICFFSTWPRLFSHLSLQSKSCYNTPENFKMLHQKAQKCVVVAVANENMCKHKGSKTPPKKKESERNWLCKKMHCWVLEMCVLLKTRLKTLLFVDKKTPQETFRLTFKPTSLTPAELVITNSRSAAKHGSKLQHLFKIKVLKCPKIPKKSG